MIPKQALRVTALRPVTQRLRDVCQLEPGEQWFQQPATRAAQPPRSGQSVTRVERDALDTHAHLRPRLPAGWAATTPAPV
jgi:hypothetical protein